MMLNLFLTEVAAEAEAVACPLESVLTAVAMLTQTCIVLHPK
jgi:hypothetical protein